MDKLILASKNLYRQGKTVFSIEDLVVEAWKMFPNTFGLRGNVDDSGKPKYPDSNRVYAEVMGRKPLRTRGLIEKVGTKRYQLTESGRSLAELLSKRGQEGGDKKIILEREVLSKLFKIRDSRATQKVLKGDIDSVTFFDACNFWGITARSYSVELEGKLARIEQWLDIVKTTLSKGGSTTVHGGRGRRIQLKDIEEISSVNHKLQKKFKKELGVIKGRKDQRKRPEF
ncbi:MAG: hypothetical protein H8D67_20370 [Deltaproteobacteria bacterium]|nr:hypothetical protein [Deltaproteobacteria bacterium]